MLRPRVRLRQPFSTLDKGAIALFTLEFGVFLRAVIRLMRTEIGTEENAPQRAKRGHEKSRRQLHVGRDALRALLVLTISVVVFLWSPLTSGGWFAAGNISGFGGMFSLSTQQNAQLRQIDVPVVILPWTQFDVEEVRSGRLPEWNSYNGSGVPHIGNLQSAAFSPYTIPFYLLSMQWALLVSASLVLLVAGMSTYGLVRYLKLPWLAGVTAALLYMYSTFIMIWLRWPLSSSASFLPLILWSALAVVASRNRFATFGWAAMLAVSLALSIFAGHVETLACGLTFVGLWVASRLVWSSASWKERMGRCLWIGGAGFVGLALCAVQLLPFIEYILRSSILEGRSVQGHIAARWIGTVAFPFLYGAPQTKFQGPYVIDLPFHETITFAFSAFGLVLAAIGVVTAKKSGRRTPYFLLAVAALMLTYGFDFLGVGSLIDTLPGSGLLMATRMAVVWGLAMSLLAAYGVAAVTANWHPDGPFASRNVRSILIIAAAAGGLLAFFGGIAYFTLGSHVGTTTALAVSNARGHMVFVLGTLLVGLAMLFFATRERQVVRRIGAYGVLVILFAQSGFLFRSYNATSTKSQFMLFPKTAQRVVDAVGQNQTLWLDDARIMPDLNLWVRVHSPSNYDVINLATYERLYRQMLRPPNRVFVGGAELGILDAPIYPIDPQSLQVMGIRRVVTSESYPLITQSALGYQGHGASQAHQPSKRLFFQWRGAAPNVAIVYAQNMRDGSRINVAFGDGILSKPIQAHATVHDSLAVVTIPSRTPRGGWRRIKFEPGGNAQKSARVIGARIVRSRTPGLSLLTSIDKLQIFGVPGPSGIATSPPQVLWVNNHGEAFNQTTKASFDPLTSVVIEGDRRGRQEVGGGTVAILKQAPRKIAMKVTRPTPGFVLVNQNDYPGWTATVNGRKTPILRANSTFMAVAVPAGASTVTFTFSSGTVQFGLWVSACSAALLLAGISIVMIRRPRLSDDASTSGNVPEKLHSASSVDNV